MKSKLHKQVLSAVVLCLIAVLVLAATKTARAAENENVPYPAAVLPAPPAIDPATGLPLPPPPKQWKAPEWKDPEIVLTNVIYDGLPLEEVARDLRERFKDCFDVLLPVGWQDPNRPSRNIEPLAATIRLRLRSVTASEVFGAMNLVFETENTPLRWELMMNGRRPTAVLRILPELVPFDQNQPQPAPPEEPMRMICFVGDLIGDEKSGGMTMELIAKTLSEVYDMAYGTSGGAIPNRLQFHKEAQLLVITGKKEEIAFVQNALSALRQKVKLETERKVRPTPVEPKVKSEATNT